MQKYRKLLIKKLKSSELIDIPKKFEEKDYQETSKNYIRDVSKNQALKAIYSVGSVSVLGLSDLDYFLILENKKQLFAKYLIKTRSKKDRYLFLHEGWFMNKEVFKNIKNWFPIFEISHLYGDKIRINKKNNNYIDTFLSIQYILTKIPGDIINYSFKEKKLYIRTLLAIINSFFHLVNLCTSFCKIKNLNKIKELEKSFKAFRKNWFLLNKKQRIEDLIDFTSETIIMSYDLIKSINNYLKKELKISDNAEYFEFQLNKKNKLKFTFNYTKEIFFDNLIKYNQVVLPSSLGIYLFLWSNKKGVIGNSIKKRINKTIYFTNIPKQMIIAFNNHSEVIEEYYLFNKKYLKSPPIPYHILWTPLYKNEYKVRINWIYRAFFVILYRIKNRLF